MKKSTVVFLSLSLALAQGALASGGSGGGSNSGKKADDPLAGVKFPSTSITSVIDDSRVRAATVPVFAVPAVAPIGLPAMQIPAIPTVTLPFADVQRQRGRLSGRGGDATLETSRGGELEVRGRTAEVAAGMEISGGSSTLDGKKAYDLAGALPMANPFAPWKTAPADLVPTCQ